MSPQINPQPPAHREAKSSSRPRVRRALLKAFIWSALFIFGGASANAATLCVEPSGAGGCHMTIQAAINAASPGDTINVAAGTYAEQVDVNKALTLLGPNANINPNTGTRVAEAVIIPTASDPLNPSFAGPSVVTLSVSGVTFRGFTVDGDNPGLTSGVVFNGADVDAEFGIYGTETANPDAVLSNNIVKNIGEIAVWINSNGQGGAKNANSRITTNKVDNVLGAFGQGIRISDDAWLDVTDNVVTRVRLGVVIENYSGNTTTHPASVIARNRISAFRIGIRHNLHYVYANPGFTIRDNTVEAYAQTPMPPQVSTPTSWQGIRLESIQQTVAATVTDNAVDGNRTALQGAGYTRIEGLNVTNASATSPNMLFTLNRVTDNIRGVYHETPAVPIFNCNEITGNLSGIVLDAAATNGLVANNNNIAGNTTIGVQNNGPATVNAQSNWWGAANGPGPVGPGSGDGVSTNVDFSNFLTSAVPIYLTVTPANMQGWQVVTSNTGQVTGFQNGPGTPPLGTGSASFSVGPDGNGAAELRHPGYANQLLSALTTLSYSTYVQQDGSGGQAPYIILRVDHDNNSGTPADLLFFEPVYQSAAFFPSNPQAPLVVGAWQTWDARNGGWWSVNGFAGLNPGTGVKSLDTYFAAFPNAKIVNSANGLGGVRLVAGFGAGAWDNFIGNVDNFKITCGCAPCNQTTYDFEFVPYADLAVDKTTTVDPARENQIFGYNLTVTNAGPSTATGVTVIDTLPAGPSFVSATSSQGVCVHSSGTVTCNVGSMASGATVNIQIKVKPRATGTLTNTATVSSDLPDINTSNNSKTINTEVIPHVDLKLVKSDSPDPIMLGNNTTYTLTVTNNGLSATATGVVITDTLPAGMSFVSSPSCTHSAGVVTCNVGNLAKGASASVTIVVQSTGAGVQTNTATASSSVADKEPADNTANHNTTVITIASLAISPSTAQGSCENSAGTVTLTAPAPAGGATVSLASNNAAASVPPSVFIPAGSSSAPFAITTSAVGSNKMVNITATQSTTVIAKVLTVIKVGVDDLTLSTNTISAGNSLTGTVTLKCAAAPGSVFVQLSSSNTGVAQTPASVTIPAGATTSAPFNITTTNPGSATIKARVSGSTFATEVLTVTP